MQPLYEDDVSITYRMDDGMEHRIPKRTAQNIGLPAPQAEAHNLGLGQAPSIHPNQNANTDIQSLEQPAPVPLSGGEETLPMPQQNPLASIAQAAGQGIQQAVTSPQAQQHLEQRQAQEERQAKLQGYQNLSAPQSSRQGAANVGSVAAMQSDALQAKSDAEVAQSRAMAAQQEQILQETERRNAGIEAHSQKQAENEQRMFAEAEAARKKYMDAEIDPNRFWKSRSGGQKVMAGIAMALSGIGKAANVRMGLEKPGGMLMPLQMMLEAADKDVAMQEKQIAKLGSNVKMMDEGLESYMQLGKTQQERLMQSRALYLEYGAMQLKHIEQATKDPIIAANAAVMQGQIAQEAARFGYAAATSREAAEAAERQHKDNMRLKWAQHSLAKSAMEQDRINKERQLQMEQGKAAVLDLETGKPVGFSRYGEKGAQEVAEAAMKYRDYRSAADAYDRKRKEYGRQYGGWGSGKWPSEAKRELDALHTGLMTKYMYATGGKQLSDKESEMFEKIIPSAETWTTRGNNDAILAQFRDGADRQIRDVYVHHGVARPDEKEKFPSYHYDMERKTSDAKLEDTRAYDMGNAKTVKGAAKPTLQYMEDLAGADIETRDRLAKLEDRLRITSEHLQGNPGDQHAIQVYEQLEQEASPMRERVAKADDAYIELSEMAKGSGKGAKQAQAVLRRWDKKRGRLAIGPAQKREDGKYRYRVGDYDDSPLGNALHGYRFSDGTIWTNENDPEYMIRVAQAANDPNHPDHAFAKARLRDLSANQAIPENLVK